jgi:tetratricopeptide (TPR) repeat protein
MASEPSSPLERARVLCELRRFGEAVTLASEAIAADPRDTNAWCLMAEAQLGQDQPRAALQAALAAAAQAPTEPQPQRLASIALAKLDRPDEALLAAELAVKLGPTAWEPHVQLAEALSGVEGRLDEAQHAADRAVELGPSEARTHLAAGAVAAAAGRKPEAADSFREALRIDPNNSRAYNALARLNLGTVRLSQPNPGGVRLRPPSPGRVANAAAGIAQAVRADPREAVSRRDLDGNVPKFLGWMSYVIVVAALLTIISGSHNVGGGARILPLAILAVPLALVVRFARRLPGSLRAHLVRLATSDQMRVPSGLELFAVVVLIAGGASSGARPAIGFLAACATLAARTLLMLSARRVGTAP